ncbi:MAG: glycine zipper 2TM domain-containing protein [Magnetococcales bacterium]|nr:glycine zipper 2TM domain-containing protein [Magnetococcales bacterium]
MKSGFVIPLTLSGFLLLPVPLRADAGQGATVGALSGALVGSLSGPVKNRVENSLIGAVAGGLLGAAIGGERERQGQVVVHRSLEYAPSYQTSTWIHPDTRVSYVVTPRPVSSVRGRVCREVEIRAMIDDRGETLSGLACRDGYGQWRLVDRVSVDPLPSRTVVVSRPVTRHVVVEAPPPVYYYPAPVVIHRGWGNGPYPRYYDRDWRDRHWRRHR